MNSDKPKLCIECRHYEIATGKNFTERGKYICGRKGLRSMVDSSPIGPTCENERQTCFDEVEGMCGSKGKFWEEPPYVIRAKIFTEEKPVGFFQRIINRLLK